MAPKGGLVRTKPVGQAFKDKSKPADVRTSNISAAKVYANWVVTHSNVCHFYLTNLTYPTHFLDKIKVMVVKDIEREDIEFVCKTLGCRPIASLDHFLPENLVSADLAEEVSSGTNKFVKITGIQNQGRTVSVIVRGSNKLVLEEAERSIHDALCVVRCLVKKRALIAGGGAPEIELALQLATHSNTLEGVDAYCFRAFAEALEVIPSTLAENAGLNPIATVTELRNRHAQGEINTGINVRKGSITDILTENVVQPLLVSVSAITLASETVRSILKIDDIINTIN